jgi:MFS family permease
MSAMENTGRLLSPALGGLLAGFWDIRAPFVAHALLALISIIPSFKLLKETAPHLRTDASSRPKTADIPDAGFVALFTFPVLIFFVAQIFASLTRGPIFTGQINLYGAYAYDLDPQTIGFLATTVTAMGIPISIASGHIMDRFGRKTTLVPGFTLLAVAMVLIGITAYAHLPLHIFIAAYFFVHGSNSITGGNMQTLGSDIAPERARGRFYGVWHTLGNLGGPIGTSAFAALSGAAYWAAFSLLAVTSAGAAFILGALVHDKVRAARAASRTQLTSGGAPEPTKQTEGATRSP